MPPRGNPHLAGSVGVVLPEDEFQVWAGISRPRPRFSISAEHGLGRLKRKEITRYKSALEIEWIHQADCEIRRAKFFVQQRPNTAKTKNPELQRVLDGKKGAD